jgi:hypothetical protein
LLLDYDLLFYVFKKLHCFASFGLGFGEYARSLFFSLREIKVIYKEKENQQKTETGNTHEI